MNNLKMEEDNQSVDSPAQSNPGTPLPSNPDSFVKRDTSHYFMATDTTTYYADSVEWCPFEHLSNFFVCGTYQLDEKLSSCCENQIRLGNVVLYKLYTSESDSTASFNLLAEDIISTSGILDMKWSVSMLNDKIVLGLVCSDGKILLKFINENDKNISLSSLTDFDLSENGEKMLLSLDWSLQNENSASIITSDTGGFLNYLKVGQSDLSLLLSWKAHSFESWIAAFNYSDQNVIYSGGDDCCFKSWDLRSLSSPIFSKKSHTMGVTAISKSKLNDNILVSGSYDENILLWDTRHMKSPLSDVNVGGGIWRLKWHPDNPQLLLSAAMHNGFHVLSLKDDKLNVELSHTAHKSLAYGVDWNHMSVKSNLYHKELLSNLDNCGIKNVIASCSFYDNLLNVWGINF